MSVKNLTILALLLGLTAACGRGPRSTSYTEVILVPPASESSPRPPELPPNHPLRQGGVGELPENHPPRQGELPENHPLRGGMQAPPLAVEPVPENRPPDHPTLTGRIGGQAGSSPANTMLGRESEIAPPPQAEDLEWTVPEGWQQLPPQGIRLAEFRVEGDMSGALATLIVLGPQAGTLDANLRRWRGLVNLPPEPTAQPPRIQGSNMTFTFVDMVEESLAAGNETSTLVAIYDLGNRNAFLRFTGPTDLLNQQRLRFLTLADSVRQVEETP